MITKLIHFSSNILVIDNKKPVTANNVSVSELSNAKMFTIGNCTFEVDDLMNQIKILEAMAPKFLKAATRIYTDKSDSFSKVFLMFFDKYCALCSISCWDNEIDIIEAATNALHFRIPLSDPFCFSSVKEKIIDIYRKNQNRQDA